MAINNPQRVVSNTQNQSVEVDYMDNERNNGMNGANGANGETSLTVQTDDRRTDDRIHFRSSEEMQRLTDAAFELFDRWKEEDPNFALECLREAKSVVKIAVDAKGVVSGARGIVRGANIMQQKLKERVRQRREASMLQAQVHPQSPLHQSSSSKLVVDVDAEIIGTTIGAAPIATTSKDTYEGGSSNGRHDRE